MYRPLLVVTLVGLAAAIAGCGKEKPAQPQMPPARVTVLSPVTIDVTDYWLYNGYLETTMAVEVRSKIRGFLAKVEFTEGAEVDVGTPLYKIDKLEYETARDKTKAEHARAEATIKNWEAQIVQAKADLARVTEAVRSGAESKTEQDKAQAMYDVRVAERDAAIASRDAAASALKTAEIQLGYTDIRAKSAGRISQTLVHEGNLIQADTTLMTTILKVDKLYVYFDAPESDFLAFQRSLINSPKGTTSDSFPVEVGVLKDNGYPHLGVIDFRENRVETSTGTIRIRGIIDNPMTNNFRLLLPGMYARVRVPKGPPTPQLTIPEDCILTGQEGRFLYVVNAENKVEKRIVTIGSVVWKYPAVTPGIAPATWVAVNPSPTPPLEGQPPMPSRRIIKSIVAIREGLKPGDRVVLDGIQRIKPGDTVISEAWTLQPPK